MEYSQSVFYLGKAVICGDIRMAECIRKEYNKQTENAVLFKGWNQ